MANFALNFAIGTGLQLISALTAPPQRVGKLESKSLPESSYGSEIAIGYGLFPFRAILAHLPDKLTETKRKRGKVGAKVIEYTYSATMQFLICDGFVASIPYLTFNGDPVVDLLASKSTSLVKSRAFLDKVFIRPGTQGQLPVAALEAIAPNNIAPPNRGMAHLTLPNWELSETLGNRPPLVQGIAATVGIESSQALDRYLPRPFNGAVAANQSIANVASFTANQSINLTFPLTADYQILLAGTNPSVSVGGFALSYSSATQQWSSRGVVVQAMPSADQAGGSFIDVGIAGNTVTYRINGVLVDTFTVGAGVRALAITSTEWAATEVTLNTPTDITRYQPALVSLASILQDICDRAGIPCNTTEITDQIVGVALQGSTPAEWISQLQSIFAFLVVDRGGTIHFLNGDRPLSVERTAPLTDFGLSEAELYTIEQSYPSELPYQCQVTYYDLLARQEKSVYFRLDTQDEGDRPLSDTILSVNTSAVMTQDQAQGIAEMTLIRTWNERELITLTGTFAHADLEPGDVLVLPLFGGTVRLIIIEVNVGANYAPEFKCMRYSRAAWRAKRTPTLTQDPIVQDAATYAAVYASDTLPKLKGSHPTNPVYLAASHQVPPYRQATIAASADGGNSYVQAATQQGPAAVGVAAKLSTTGTSVLVRVSDTLSTVTASTYANNTTINRLAINNEIIRFQDALLLGSHRGYRYYRLSTLQRGQLATTTANHGLWGAIALCSDLIVLDREDLGNAGSTIKFDLFTDGNDHPLPELDFVL